MSAYGSGAIIFAGLVRINMPNNDKPQYIYQGAIKEKDISHHNSVNEFQSICWKLHNQHYDVVSELSANQFFSFKISRNDSKWKLEHPQRESNVQLCNQTRY